MTRHRVPRLALALLERLVPDSAPLAGDLVEELERRRSRVWFWWQVLAAIATTRLQRSGEIRPLRLVEFQPADAVERSRKWSVRFRPVNLAASPLPDVGGLGLVVLGFLLTSLAPGAWWLLLASTVPGALLGIAIIAIHAKSLERRAGG
jgi:hypothetical protein